MEVCSGFWFPALTMQDAYKAVLLSLYRLESISMRWRPPRLPCRSNWMWLASLTPPSPPVCPSWLAGVWNRPYRWKASTSCATERAGWLSRSQAGGVGGSPTFFPNSQKSPQCATPLKRWGGRSLTTWLCRSATRIPAATLAIPCTFATSLTTCLSPPTATSTQSSLVILVSTWSARYPWFHTGQHSLGTLLPWRLLKIRRKRNSGFTVSSARMALFSGTAVLSSFQRLLKREVDLSEWLGRIVFDAKRHATDVILLLLWTMLVLSVHVYY